MILWHRREEILSIIFKLAQISLNIWLAVSLKSESKSTKTNSSSNSQMGLVTTPTKSPLSTAHQISMNQQQGNYYFGQYYPELIRAMITLYLAIILLHTLHSKIKTLLLTHQKLKMGSCVTLVLIILLSILDIAIVNDVIHMNGDTNNLSNYPVQDLYTSSSGPFKIRNKELDTLIGSIIIIYRWTTIIFLIRSFWILELKPFLKGRRQRSSS